MPHLFGPRHAVERVDRHPVPAAHERALAVDVQRVRQRVLRRVLVRSQLDRAEADAKAVDVVQALLAVAIRPPALRVALLERELAVDLDTPDRAVEADARQALGL